jgi:hypothetical protein
MKKTLLLLLIILALFPKSSFSQIYIEPFAGYQKDLNNHKDDLINSGVQIAFKKKNYELLFQIQKDWPQKLHSSDSSFSVNPGFPLYSPAEKEVSTYSWSLAMGNRFKIAGKKTKNSLFIKFYTGIMYQKTKVNYQYDKTDYVILNPDQTQNSIGPFISGGLEYMRQIGNGRLFFDLNFSSPPGDKYHSPHLLILLLLYRSTLDTL